MRKVLAAVAGIVAVVGLSALPAAAHHTTVSATAVCVQQDVNEYVVTWSIKNSESDKTMVASDRLGVIGIGKGATGTQTEDVAPGSSLSLVVSGLWSNGVTHTDTGSFTVPSDDCYVAPPPPEDEPPTTVPPVTPPTTPPTTPVPPVTPPVVTVAPPVPVIDTPHFTG